MAELNKADGRKWKHGMLLGAVAVTGLLAAAAIPALATPGSVDSIPGKSNAEDHFSNSTWCARKARTIVENVEYIVAMEILMAAQALSLIEPIASEHPIGVGSAGRLAHARQVMGLSAARHRSR